jgi:exodeoxyribonuclease-1
VTSKNPFVYTSGRYPGEYNKTALVVSVLEIPDKSGSLVYDLRADPDEYVGLTAAQLAKRWADRSDGAPYFPVKLLKYNKCPAVAPASVLEVGNGYKNLQLHKELANNHLAKLQKLNGFGDELIKAMDIMWPKRQAGLVSDQLAADTQLYDGFVPGEDKTKMAALRAAKPEQITEYSFKDGRLTNLAPLYKARNYPKFLNDQVQSEYEAFRVQKLINSGKAEEYFKRLEELLKTPGLDGEKQYLIEEMNLYAQSILPA